MTARTLLMASILLFGLSSSWALEDGRIGLLYVGCIARSQPFWTMRSDPLFSASFVQATTRDWGAWGPIQKSESHEATQRMVRLYMPRTYKTLMANFDVVVIANANRIAVGPKNTEMLAKGVREAGMGLAMGGGWESFGGNAMYPAWGETAIGELLPTEDDIDMYIEWGSLVIDRKDHELIRSLPWETQPAFARVYWHNRVSVKLGAQELAHVEGYGIEDPGMVTWEIGNGARVFAITAEIHRAYQHQEVGGYWEYGLDLGANLVIYLDRRPVPQDLQLVHSVREKIFEINTRRGIVTGLLDFLDSFGANTNRLQADVDGVDRALSAAKPVYLQLQFEEALEAYTDVGKMMVDIERKAMRFKDRALLWVYLIEWLTVTGTALMAGLLLWSLMVRRRLFREVSVTRSK